MGDKFQSYSRLEQEERYSLPPQRFTDAPVLPQQRFMDTPALLDRDIYSGPNQQSDSNVARNQANNAPIIKPQSAVPAEPAKKAPEQQKKVIKVVKKVVKKEEPTDPKNLCCS